MFGFHKCRYEKINEVKVYHSDEMETLFNKVTRESNKMNFLKNDHFMMIKHMNTFTMKLEKNMFHLFVVPVIINNKTYRFIIDTGAQISGIMDIHKDKIKSNDTNHSIGIKSASGSKCERDIIYINRIFLGGLEILNHHFVLLDKNQFRIPLTKKHIVEFDGIIGWDLLSQIDFEIDDKNNVFSMIESKDMFTYCNMIKANFPTVIVYDDNKHPALFGIDSGAEVSWVSNEYTKTNNLHITKEIKGMNIGVHGIEKMDVNIIKECSISFYESHILLENVRSGETKVFMNLALDGILGNEIFYHRKIQFLNSKGIVRIL